MHHLRVLLMVGLEGLDGVLPILDPIPHPNRTPLQFTCFSGKGISLEVMHHLQFVFDITQK